MHKVSEIMAYGKSMELFLANGTVDSFITAGLSNRNGKNSSIFYDLQCIKYAMQKTKNGRMMTWITTEIL